MRKMLIVFMLFSLCLLVFGEAPSHGLGGKWEIGGNLEFGHINFDLNRTVFNNEPNSGDNPGIVSTGSPFLQYYLSDNVSIKLNPYLNLLPNHLTYLGLAAGASAHIQLTDAPVLFLSPGVYGRCNNTFFREMENPDIGPDESAHIYFVGTSITFGADLRLLYLITDKIGVHSTFIYPLVTGRYNYSNTGDFSIEAVTNPYLSFLFGFSLFF